MPEGRRAAIGAAVGVALLVGAVVWKLAGSTYALDVRTICDAERRSGYLLKDGMSTVTAWVRANLKTSDGNLLFSSLGDTEMARRAERLRHETFALGMSSCSMIETYERLAADAELRRDVQRLCSSQTFPGFAELDDEARLARLEDWIDAHSKSPRTKLLGDPLRRADAPQRADVLRSAARQIDVLSCDLAKVLDVPNPQ